ncbi:MAG: Smr/MutS family protein [Proteobacteria bacterium]|nr:Smr/MutS family protein [Pseudomonadota bacterium]
MKADLAAIKAELARRQAAEAERAAAAAAAAATAARERQLFAHSVGPVAALKAPPKAQQARTPVAPEPRQRQQDEAAALREALSDDVDVASLLLTDDGLAWRRSAVPADVVVRLRRGQWSVQAELDLHGLRRDAARDALATFIRQARQQGQRCVRVVHGKGHGSPGRQPVLKDKVQRWLAQSAAVMAFTQAPRAQGGAGALVVLLDGTPKS